MNIKKITGLVLATIMLLPILVTATVIITYQYPTSTSATQPFIYLEQGPNYNTANSLGLFYATQTTTTPNNIISGTKIYINYTAGASETYLLNVLDIKNAATSSVTVTFTNVNLPNGVTMYYSVGNEAQLGTLVSTVSTGTSITLSSGSVVYLSFVWTGTPTTSTSGEIDIQYTVPSS